jgi:hypothetical protein
MAEEILGEDGEADSSEEAVTGSTSLTAEENVKESAGEAASTDTVTDSNSGDHDTDTKADGQADAITDGAPTEYQITLPDGITVDPNLMESFTGQMRELDATQEQAQKLADLQLQNIQQVSEMQLKAWETVQTTWREAAESDEEYGKGKYDENLVIARSAVRQIGGTALSTALEETGMGNHPEFIRFFWRVGNAIREDQLDFGSANIDGGKTLAERMFPNQGKEQAA